jgi:hypothetical protein
MSRSHHKIPVIGNKVSGKDFKKYTNKVMRQHSLDSEIHPKKQEASDIWNSVKEHKGVSNDPKDKRK